MMNKQKTSRVRGEDMQKAIYTLRKDVDTIVDQNDNQEPSILVFTILGKENEFVDQYGHPQKNGFPLLWDIEHADGSYVLAETLEKAYAKSITTNRLTKYFIKCGGDGRMYNPLGLYDENRHTKQVRAGISQWKFREVSRNIFKHYLNFLRTKNVGWLSTAQRELL